ncbi:MAG: hypothetical protein AAGM22_14575 [Acidobacteriota bacterium]
MNAFQRILDILAAPQYALDEVEDSYACVIEREIETYGWPAVHDALLDVLLIPEDPPDWEPVAETLWCCLDYRPLDEDRVIAHLYFRAIDPADPPDSENLVWSIASNLLGLGYLSDQDPRTKPAVAKILGDLSGGI